MTDKRELRGDELGHVIRTDDGLSIFFARPSGQARTVCLRLIVDLDAADRIIGVEVLNLREQTRARSVGGVRIDESTRTWIDERIGPLRITFDATCDAFYCYLSPGARIAAGAPAEAFASLGEAGDITRLAVTIVPFAEPNSA